MGPEAQALNCIQHVRLLGHEGASQFDGPREIPVHSLDDGGKLRQGFDAGIPGLRVDIHHYVRLSKLEGGIPDFERIHGCRQDHANEIICVESNGLDELIELGGTALGWG
jgi:hypothetical protein